MLPCLFFDVLKNSYAALQIPYAPISIEIIEKELNQKIYTKSNLMFEKFKLWIS